MNVRNIFQRNPTDEVPVPEIEVDGDKVRVPREAQGVNVRVPQNPEAEEPGFTEETDSREQGRENREYRLPKTKWFA